MNGLLAAVAVCEEFDLANARPENGRFINIFSEELGMPLAISMEISVVLFLVNGL